MAYWNGLWIVKMLTKNHQNIRNGFGNGVGIGVDESAETKDGRVTSNDRGQVRIILNLFRFLAAKFNSNL